MRVGLLGGSFNPPHAGHVHISMEALKTLKLDAVWWLVSPHNPLKADITPLPLNERVELCQNLVNHPQILISDLEKELGTRITYFSVKKLKTYFPKVEFVWLTGMDNALTLHHWNYWKNLLEEIPTAHLTRMPVTSLIQSCPLRQYKRQSHIFLKRAKKVPLKPGFTYWLMQKKMIDVSSSEIRSKTVL